MLASNLYAKPSLQNPVHLPQMFLFSTTKRQKSSHVSRRKLNAQSIRDDAVRGRAARTSRLGPPRSVRQPVEVYRSNSLLLAFSAALSVAFPCHGLRSLVRWLTPAIVITRLVSGFPPSWRTPISRHHASSQDARDYDLSGLCLLLTRHT
jgi:hypothetical protein